MNEQKTLSAAARAKLAQVGSANVANALLKRGFRNVYLLGLSPLSPDQPQLVGPAYTLRFMPANSGRTDNRHRRAVEECPVEHVLVIDTCGCLRSAAAGDLMAARMRQRGVAGVVTDGGYRDTPAIRKTGLPAYQRQSAPPATPIAMPSTMLDAA